MAGGLSFVFRVVNLNDFTSSDVDPFPTPTNIPELQNLLANQLEDADFKDVVNTPSEVALTLHDVRIAIIHLPFDGPNVHQIIVGGGTGNTQREVNLIANFVGTENVPLLPQ